MEQSDEDANNNAIEREIPTGHQTVRLYVPVIRRQSISPVQAPGSAVSTGQPKVLP